MNIISYQFYLLFEINFIQEELFSENQWLQFINEYEKESQSFLASEEIDTSLNLFTNTDCLTILYSEHSSLNSMLG